MNGKIIILLGGLTLAALATRAPAQIAEVGSATPATTAPASSTDEEIARTLHLLNRAAFGPSLRSLEEVQTMGRSAWLLEQLQPQNTADSALEEKLAVYPALAMSTSELLTNYPIEQSRDEPAGIGRPQRIPTEVAAAQLTRAVHARAQLREVMTDFWFNHFNVYSQAGLGRQTIVAYLRDAIRPHALGRFGDMLRATAESPAMLYYLDNYRSSRPGSAGRYSGINENYARELLELHTLGVNGGYTQEDIVEVARAFTGWTFTPARTGAIEFVFVPQRHIGGAKELLGTKIPAGDTSEGLAILKLLAAHPSTAQHIARKLLTRLVTEDPPQGWIDRTAAVFLATDGDIAWTVGSILGSAEFYGSQYRRNKAKTPLELVASTLRAVDADITVAVESARRVADLGQPLLRANPPTGWPEYGHEILSPGGMVSRFEFGYFAAADRLEGVRTDRALWEPIVGLWGPAGLAQYLLGELPGPATMGALTQAAENGAAPDVLAAIVLASPEFQLQ